MAEIIKIYRESFPKQKFIGKRYTNADRKDGLFAHKWTQWHQNDWFQLLSESTGICNPVYGFMRLVPDQFESTFEYWIGVMATNDAAVPVGFDTIELDKSDAGICRLKGKEPEIYQVEDKCNEALAAKGLGTPKLDKEGRLTIFERYDDERFMADDNGDCVLDYGMMIL
jgi:predicted transcriptional regulator YdeE